MIADCHTHLNITAGIADIAGHLDACEKVDACIVLAEPAESSEKVNRELAEAIKDQPGLVGFGVFDPLKDSPVLKKVKAMTSAIGLKGVVLYCPHVGFHPAHSRVIRLYEAACDLGLTVFFHNCEPFDSQAILDFVQPHLIDEVARKFPLLKIIIGGMGSPFVWQTVSMVQKHENVFADLTIDPQRPWQVYNMVIACHEAGVMDKLIFGSGFPDANPGECIETLLGFNKLMANAALPNVPREEIRAVIERDTMAVLGIEL